MAADRSEDTGGAEAPLDAEEAAVTPVVKPTPREAADIAFNLILEKKARDVLMLDIGACSDLADYMLIATAGSSRQVAAVAKEVDRKLRDLGLRRLNLAGLELGVWAILDYGDLFVHVMQERERRYYDLEALWADGVEIRRETAPPSTEPEPVSDEDLDAAAVTEEPVDKDLELSDEEAALGDGPGDEGSFEDDDDFDDDEDLDDEDLDDDEDDLDEDEGDEAPK